MYKIIPFFIKISANITNKKKNDTILIKMALVLDIIKNSSKQKKDNIIITILKNFSPFSIEKTIKEINKKPVKNLIKKSKHFSLHIFLSIFVFL